MIKTILLDLDDTILDFKSCEKQALAASLTNFGIAFCNDDVSEYSRINDQMWKLLEKGQITREELKTQRFRLFLNRFDASVSPERFAETYMQNLSQTGVLIDGALELLQYLSQNYALYAVTNGYESTQRGRIAASGIAKYFDDIFISQLVGADKPQKVFFDYCAAHITGFSIKNTVLIGDSPTSDISGGNEYGLFTIRYNPKHLINPPEAMPKREVYSLSEIPALLLSL